MRTNDLLVAVGCRPTTDAISFRLLGDPSGRRLHFVDFDLVVPNYDVCLILLGQLQNWLGM